MHFTQKIGRINVCKSDNCANLQINASSVSMQISVLKSKFKATLLVVCAILAKKETRQRVK